MPPKRRLNAKGPAKPMPKIVLSPEDELNLKNEIDWTITQLQLNLQKCKNAADAEKITKLITLLGSIICLCLTYLLREHQNTCAKEKGYNEARISRLQGPDEKRSS